MLKRFNGQINVQIGPVEMIRLWKFDVEQLPDGHIFEPGEMLERHKEFPASEQEPEPMRRDVGHLNVRNVFAGFCGFYLLHIPERT